MVYYSVDGNKNFRFNKMPRIPRLAKGCHISPLELVVEVINVLDVDV
jgi:hypothetical protein